MLRGHRARLQTASSLSGELADAERAVSQLSESAYYPVRHRLSVAERELAQATEALDLHAERVTALNALTADAVQAEHPEESSFALAEFLENLSSARHKFEHDAGLLLDQSNAALTEIRNGPHLLALNQVVQTERDNVGREAAALREQGLNPDTLNELMERRDRLQRALKEFDGLEEVIAASEQRISLLSDQMRAHRIELTEKRRAFLATLELQDLEVRILPLSAHHEAIVADYQNVTGIATYGDRIYNHEDQSGILGPFISNRPYHPAPAVMQAKYDLLDSMKELHQALKRDVPDVGLTLHGTFRNRLRALSDEALDALMCWSPDDGIYIRYRAPDGRMEDISSASPGQKGASMLQFLLSYGTDPLLIDQPEDDLDCLMLSQSVIPAIAANKKRRQLIIVSHSAPIVVNGDAEYVISMKYDRTGLRPDLCGALQEQPVRALICQQMEGGEKAFRSRYARILS